MSTRLKDWSERDPHELSGIDHGTLLDGIREGVAEIARLQAVVDHLTKEANGLERDRDGNAEIAERLAVELRTAREHAKQCELAYLWDRLTLREAKEKLAKATALAFEAWRQRDALRAWRQEDIDKCVQRQDGRMKAALLRLSRIVGCECDSYEGHKCELCRIRRIAEEALL